MVRNDEEQLSPTPAGSSLGRQHGCVLPPSLSPAAFSAGSLLRGFSLVAALSFHSPQREGGPGSVWGLPFIGSPLTCGQGNGMFYMLTCSGAALSFILKDKLQLYDSPPLPPSFLLYVPQYIFIPCNRHFQRKQRSPRPIVFLRRCGFVCYDEIRIITSILGGRNYLHFPDEKHSLRKGEAPCLRSQWVCW